MILITVVDDRMGMCFNRRRLSRDRVLSDKILALTNEKVLWMSSYSEKLFDSVKHSQINIDDDCLREAAAGEYCFVETEDPAPKTGLSRSFFLNGIAGILQMYSLALI